MNNVLKSYLKWLEALNESRRLRIKLNKNKIINYLLGLLDNLSYIGHN